MSEASPSPATPAHSRAPQIAATGTLRDGTQVLIRAVRPEDRGLLLRGFEQLGPESRYRRFFAPKPALSEEDLRYLTEVDGIDHLAVGALTRDGRPLGIARYVRCAPGADVAEAAVAVVDAMQRKGLGTLLLRVLSDAARARGVRHFRCTVLTDNAGMRALLRELEPGARTLRSDAGVDEIELDLPVPEQPARQPLGRLLRMAAEQRVSMPPPAARAAQAR